MIAVVDYGLNNLHSVRSALTAIGHDGVVTDDLERLRQADGIILPGVGAFGDAMGELAARGLKDGLIQLAREGKPLLGICLGMQLLFETSEENGKHNGLGLLQGEVVRFQGDFKIPHMGWNRLETVRPDPILPQTEPGFVYFVHSYYARPADSNVLIAVADYYGRVPAIVGKDNIYGTQFHPEKSGSYGMQLLAGFARMCEKGVAA